LGSLFAEQTFNANASKRERRDKLSAHEQA
jgi:hypothetical protein